MIFSFFLSLRTNESISTILSTERNCNHNIHWKQFKFRRKANERKTYPSAIRQFFSSAMCTLTVGSLINESVCKDIINFYDSSQYLYAFGVYSRRKSARTKPRMVERKVAQMVDIFSIAVGWKLLLLFTVQQFVHWCASTHTQKRS